MGRRFEVAQKEVPRPSGHGSPWPSRAVAAGSLAALIALGVGWAAALEPLQSVVMAGMAALVSVGCIVGWAALSRPRKAAPRRGLVWSAGELFYDGCAGEEPDPVFRLSGEYGVTLLANRARTRLGMVLSSQEQTLYVAGDFSSTSHPVAGFHEVFELASTVASDERALCPAGPDGAELVLAPRDFIQLVELLRRERPGCLRALYSTDARGRPVMLCGEVLLVGEQRIDLTSPLSWRALLFREASFGGNAVYQATTIEQDGERTTLVALMPALSAPACDGDTQRTPHAQVERAVVRDIELLRAQAEQPPPMRSRFAIDRVFMLPLRRALGRAPTRVSRPDGWVSPPDSRPAA